MHPLKILFERNFCHVKWLVSCCVCVLMLSYSFPVSALQLTSDQTRVKIDSNVDVIRDPLGGLTFKEILSADLTDRWVPVVDKSTNFGFTRDLIWLRINIESISPERQWLMEVEFPLLDQLDAYFVVNGELIQLVHSGDFLYFSDRTIEHRNFVFHVPYSDGGAMTIYLKAKNTGIINLPITFWDQQTFWQQDQAHTLFKGVFFGFVFVMIIYNLFIYVSVRDVSYFYYVGYAASILWFQFCFEGFAFQYLWQTQVEWNQIAWMIFLSGAAVFRCLFTISFLNIEENSPKAHRFLMTLVWVSALFGFSAFILPHYFSTRAAAILVLPTTLSCFCIGMFMYYKGVQSARCFVWGWSFYFVGVIVSTLAHFGWLPTNAFSKFAVHLGVMIEIVLFSIALADRINRERRERNVAQKESIRYLQRFKSLYDNAIEGIFQCLPDGKFISVNASLATIMGFQNSREFVDEINGRGINQFLDLAIFNKLLSTVLEKGKIVDVEVEVLRRDGQPCWLSISAKLFESEKNANESIVVGFVFDMTARKRDEEQLLYLARHDPLTGLVNRREFENRLVQALDDVHRNQEEHCLLFLDLDQFRLINDSCGHVAGDELLRQVTKCIRNQTRGGDTVCRFGGDEFGIVLANCPLDKALNVADKIRKDIQSLRFVWESNFFELGVSIGLVGIGSDLGTLKELLNAADAACGRAKEEGRNRVYIYDALSGQLESQHVQVQWGSKISESMEKNYFELYVQPIVAVDDDENNLSSYEVLLRLCYDGELVFPGAFLPAAERYNLMPKVDRWVVKTLFQWLSDNPEKVAGISDVSINLSGVTLGDQDFSDYMKEQFKCYDIPTHLICFEITETVAVTNLSNTIRFMEEFQAMGCSFSLDDFGSGFSSYGYLKNLPVDYLKIDGSFVKDIETDKIDYAMVESIHRIGHVMGKKTIAEFVENQEIMRLLKIIGVDYAQGYGISKPFPIDEIPLAPKK